MKQKGFTLVELIVVIAIIGVLAAILVPAMIGYIKDSKMAAANSNAKTLYSAVNSYSVSASIRGFQIPAGSYTLIEIDTDAYSDMLYAPFNSDDDVKDALISVAACTLADDANGSIMTVTINSAGFVDDIYWAKTARDNYVGSYPLAKEDATPGGIGRV